MSADPLPPKHFAIVDNWTGKAHVVDTFETEQQARDALMSGEYTNDEWMSVVDLSKGAK